MLKNITRSPIQKALLVITFIISVFLQIPQPPLDLDYYISLAAQQTSGDTVRPLNGKIVAITGATNGLGLELSKKVYNLGATVIAIGRSPAKLSNMVKELNPDGDDDKRIVTVLADLSDMNSVSAAGDEIKSRFKSIDYLVNNAGMTNNSYQKQETVQGFDTVFAVNYLSHFLLTEKLLPLLEKSKLNGGSRIVQVSSSLHFQAQTKDLITSLDSIAPEASLPSDAKIHNMRAYGNSKMAQIYHMRALNRQLEKSGANVKVVSICPTWVATHIAGSSFKNVLDVFAFHAHSYGLSSILYAMFAPELGEKDGNGEAKDYVTNCSIFTGKVATFVDKSPAIPYIYDAMTGIIGAMALVSQKLFASVDFRSTSMKGYDVESQDSLYAWSKTAIEPFM
ncbi:hypothetical protein CTEN210_16589 [Chaetoceros tenuissimus]|uniref:Protochlorophyllide reductase n=1 Tax=Chaetoceros tenuissimus TaxID=426638 RepID=A0AAD3D979_9STRA|nr:hypothetical protein CTEN210_16589 [Chaetoceros tenuissimus]